MVSTTSFQS
ncbi:Protein of unknown function [Lactobacillus helveticus CIRM-BIA 101]|nr:Protein of unknown function [Lactobacillus helveticus CIRM-BIA 101]